MKKNFANNRQKVVLVVDNARFYLISNDFSISITSDKKFVNLICKNYYLTIDLKRQFVDICKRFFKQDASLEEDFHDRMILLSQ